MGVLADPLCYRCKWDKGDLINLLFGVPNYTAIGRRSWVPLIGCSQLRYPMEPKCGLLGILSEIIPEEPTQVALNRALFQA